MGSLWVVSTTDQGDSIDKDFLLQLRKASHSQVLAHSDTSCKNSTARCRQPRELRESVENNFLNQGIDSSPTRGDAILDLMVINVSKLILNIKTGESLGCSDHALVRVCSPERYRPGKEKVMPLNFRRANFQLFRETVNRIPWEASLRDKGVEQSWQICREVFH